VSNREHLEKPVDVCLAHAPDACFGANGCARAGVHYENKSQRYAFVKPFITWYCRPIVSPYPFPHESQASAIGSLSPVTKPAMCDEASIVFVHGFWFRSALFSNSDSWC